MNIIDPIGKLLGSWSTDFCAWSIIFKLALSLLLSTVLGLERSSKRHSAGLRTFIAASIASTTVMIIDQFIFESNKGYHFILSGALIVAVATLSVNSILFSSRSQIKGLTTAVGLFANAITGLAIGAGLYTLALVSYLTLLASLALFPSIETYLKNRSNHFEIHLELTSSAFLSNFSTTIRQLGLVIDDIELNPAYVNSGLSVYTIAISVKGEELKKFKTHAEIIEALSSLDYVSHIEEMSN